MEQNDKSKPVNNKRNVIIIIGIVLFVCLLGFSERYIINKDGVYIIAYIYNIEKARSGRSYLFKYNYKGKEYNDFAVSSNKYMSDEGKRFFLKILPNNPDQCKMTDIRVPDSITEAPYEGWKELPIPVQE